jgi:hypothetical protein
MRYPLAGRETLAALTTGSGLIWLGRNLGDAFVEVGETNLRVRLGVLFDESIPLSDIARVSHNEWSIWGGIGVRTLRDMVAVVTEGFISELRDRLAA